MSRHDGVSCDSCLVGNFRGKRFKCLICYDYDLCATCYEAGATTTRHTTEHPMQCILTRTDFDLYYGGEAISVEQPQAFTCPFCGKMGFTESTLQDHVSSEHTDTSFEVVCPVCAALPGGDPNLVTDDFAAHLTLEHRGSRDIDEPSSSRHVRRIPQPGRGVGATRARRSNMHFSSSGGLASLSPSSRDSMDPIAELLSQLSGVRRVGGGTSQSSTTSQLQQLQMQLQLERQQAQVARQQLERLPRRTAQIASGLGTGSGGGGGSAGGGGTTSNGVGGGSGSGTSVAPVTVQPALVVEPGFSRPNAGSQQFLLSRCVESTLTEAELQQSEIERADRSFFVRELLVNALVEGLNRDTEQNALVVKASSSSSEDGASAAVGNPSVAHSAFEIESAVTGGGVSSSTSAPNVTSRVGGGGVGSSKKGQCSGGGGSGRGYGARSATSLTRETPPQQQQQQQHQQQQQQQQHNTAGNGGSTTGRNTQGQQQRVAPLGTGTVREVSVPQGVVTQRIPVTRRKFLRQMDGRNQPNEPPPPH